MTDPFDDRRAPDGRAQGHAACAILTARIPVLAHLDHADLYAVLRLYFAAGWCVRDVIHALDHLPDGQPHPGQGNAWVRGEPRDATLSRVVRRLREWRYTGEAGDRDVMDGPYTTAVTLAGVRAEENKARRRAALAEYAELAEVARAAQTGPGRLAALAAARQAGLAGLRLRARGQHRQDQFRAAQVAATRTATPDGEPAEDTAPLVGAARAGP